MKVYKKLTAILLCVGILFGVAACGDSDNSPDLSILIRAEDEDPYPLHIRVGFIYDTTVTTGTVAAQFERARFELERVLGVETRYVENVLLQQFDDAVDALTAAGCNVIVAASNRYNSAVTSSARRNIDVHFISYGGTDMSPNLSSIQPLLFHAANVNGLLAAFNTSANRIGIVADQSMYHSHGIVSAFALGVAELTHSQIDISLNWALSARISDTRRAIDDLVAQGCDIIFVYQSEDFGIRYCEEIGVKVLGFAYNVPELAENQYLSGMFMNMNLTLIDTVRTIMYGNFSRSLHRGSFNEGTVGIIRLADGLEENGTRLLVDSLIGFISEGRSPVFAGEVVDTNNIIRLQKGETFPINSIFSIRWLPAIIDVEQNMSAPLVQSELIFSDLAVKS
jgi:basic membrane lipoprotein Med (substrate-binding protein (PBP1-ABC) superfamily)